MKYNKVTRYKLTELFKQEIYNKRKYVDPENNQDWYSLTIGWAIAKGFAPRYAWDFATYIRYNTDLG